MTASRRTNMAGHPAATVEVDLEADYPSDDEDDAHAVLSTKTENRPKVPGGWSYTGHGAGGRGRPPVLKRKGRRESERGGREWNRELKTIREARGGQEDSSGAQYDNPAFTIGDEPIVRQEHQPDDFHDPLDDLYVSASSVSHQSQDSSNNLTHQPHSTSRRGDRGIRTTNQFSVHNSSRTEESDSGISSRADVTNESAHSSRRTSLSNVNTNPKQSKRKLGFSYVALPTRHDVDSHSEDEEEDDKEDNGVTINSSEFFTRSSDANPTAVSRSPKKKRAPPPPPKTKTASSPDVTTKHVPPDYETPPDYDTPPLDIEGDYSDAGNDDDRDGHSDVTDYNDDVTPDKLEDLADLEFLDNDILLKQLETRFSEGQPYTYIGDSLVAVNPCRKLDIYSHEKLSG